MELRQKSVPKSKRVNRREEGRDDQQREKASILHDQMCLLYKQCSGGKEDEH